jgi:hypothetical protein
VSPIIDTIFLIVEQLSVKRWDLRRLSSKLFGIKKEDVHMAKKSRGGRMTAAKKRAAKTPGGKGLVKKRKVGLRIMKT